MEFESFPKIGRLSRGMVITEKIDGSNAQVCISPATAIDMAKLAEGVPGSIVAVDASVPFAWNVMRVGSRSRWITPGKETDNFGFARWCVDNQESLFQLGEGRHFGEWWGAGIQRGYGIEGKRFSLFNTARWGEHNPNTPACCSVVPVLYKGEFNGGAIDSCINSLLIFGSVTEGRGHPAEGVVVYHEATKTLFKKLCVNDDQPKGKTE